MAPPVNFPAQGPDQTVFMVLFGLGFLISLIGYLTGSRTLRLVGIVLIFGATGVLLADVAATATIVAPVSSIARMGAAPAALTGFEGGEP